MGKTVNKENLLMVSIFANVLLVVALLVLVFVIFLGGLPRRPETKTVAEEVPAVVVDGELVMELAGDYRVSTEFLERILPGYLVYSDRGIYVYEPIDESLPQNQLNIDNFFYADGRTFYADEAHTQVLTGVDVSAWQGEIDWQRVAADGIGFAMIRVAYRGYGSGRLQVDSQAAANLAGATAAGLPIGVYVYSQAIDQAEAIAEARLALTLTENYELTYPVVFDTEAVSEGEARTDSLTAEQRQAIAAAFCDTVAAAGETPMIYGNISWLASRLTVAHALQYDIWLAQYYDYPLFPYAFRIWQYTDSGSVDGINTNVDMNLCFLPFGEEEGE